MSLLIKHMTEPPPPLPNAGPALQAVLNRALAKDPNARYQRAGDLAADLVAALRLAAGGLEPTRWGAEQPTRVSNRPAEDKVRTAGEPVAALDQVPAAATAAAPTRFSPPAAPPPAPPPPPAPALASARRDRRLPLVAALGAGALLLVLAGVALFGPGGPWALFAPPATTTPAPASTPTEGAASPPPSVAPHDMFTGTVGATLGALRFHNAAKPLDDVTLAVTGLPAPAAGTQYEAWLVGAGGEQRRSLGVLQLDANGAGRLELLDHDGQNLLAQYDSLEITAEPNPDPNPLPNGPAVFSNTLPAQALVHVRHLLVAFPGAPNQTALARGLLDQVTILNQYAQTISAAQQAGDLARMRRDAEGVVNLIEGREGANYKDHDGDGVVTDPGDGFGLLLNGKNLGYIEGTLEHARLAMQQPDATPNILLHGGHVITSTQNLADWAVQIRDRSLRIATAPSVQAASEDAPQVATLADRLLNGQDLNGNEIIDPLPGEAGAKTAYQHAEYMADIQVRPR
jgi:hypothetical protein